MSKRLNDLLSQRGTISDQMDAIVEKASKEKRELSAEEKTAFDDLDSDFKRCEEAIKVERRVEEVKQASARTISIPGNNAERTVPATPRIRYSKLKAFKGPTAEEDAYISGMYIRAALFRDQKAREWCAEKGFPVQVAKAQGEGSNTAGGYLVPLQFEQAIIDLRESFGTFRRNAPVVPMGSDRMSIPRRTGGLTAYFVGESAEITESEKTWGQVMLVAKKLAALSRMSTEIAEDAVINMADDLAREMAYAFAVKEDDSGWNGDGTSGYGGIIGVRTAIIDGTHTASVHEAASGNDTFAEITKGDLEGVMGKLPKYVLNPRWYVSQPGWVNMLMRIATAAGGVTATEMANGVRVPSYMGFLVEIDQTLPKVLTDLSDVAMAFFGDLSLAAKMGERRGITVTSTEDRYFELDQIGIKATERIDIVAHDLGSTTVAGPLIALVGE